MIFIYALRDPFTNEIRYIGKSKRPKERLSNQCNEKANTYRCHWIQSILAKGGLPIQEILETMPDGSNWQDRERHWIARGRELGWPLTNTTSGGDGVPDLTGESKERMLKTWKGRKHSPESLKRIGQASKGRKHTDEYKAYMKGVMKDRYFSDEHRSRLSVSVSKLTPEQAREVKRLISEGRLQKDVAAMFGVHRDTIRNIVQNRHKFYANIT